MKTKLLSLFGGVVIVSLCLLACSSNNEEEPKQKSLYEQMQLLGYWTAKEFTNTQGNIVQIHFTSSRHGTVLYVTRENTVESSFASFKEESADQIRLNAYEMPKATELKCDLKNKKLHFICDGKDYTLTKQEHDQLGIIQGKWTSAYYRSRSLKPDDIDYNTVEFSIENENTTDQHAILKFEGYSNAGNPLSSTSHYQTENIIWQHADNHTILLDTKHGEEGITYKFAYRPELKRIVLQLNWAPFLTNNYITYTKNDW